MKKRALALFFLAYVPHMMSLIKLLQLEAHKATSLVPEDMLDRAEDDPEFKGYNLIKGKAQTPIYDNGTVVGFMIPRQEPDGVWRTGPIWIDPEFRSRGLASKAIADFSKGKNVKCWIADYNLPSIRAYEKAGFSKGEEKTMGGDIGHWYFKPGGK